MRFVTNTSALLLFVAVSTAQTTLDTIKASFQSANVPRDLHVSFNPSVVFDVVFPNGIALEPGIHLPRSSTQSTPKFSAPGLTGGPFVVAAVDPDAPTPQTPTSAQIRHMLGGNFFVESGVLVNRTQAISAYRGPNPPATSDPHRYIFLLFKQPASFNSQTVVTPSTSISGFNISSFAAQVGLGNPIGGNFMIVGPDAA